MRKLSLALACAIACSMQSPSYAAEVMLPKLKMKITNTVKNQHLALCLAQDCYDIANTNAVSLEAGKIDSVVMANMENMQMYAQDIPVSCQVSVKENQLLTVSGTLVAQPTGYMLNNMNCSVTNMA